MPAALVKSSFLLNEYSLDSARGLQTLVQKLPHSLQERWVMEGSRYKERNHVTFPPFKVFSEFVRYQAKIRNDPSFIMPRDTKATRCYKKNGQCQGYGCKDCQFYSIKGLLPHSQEESLNLRVQGISCEKQFLTRRLSSNNTNFVIGAVFQDTQHESVKLRLNATRVVANATKQFYTMSIAMTHQRVRRKLQTPLHPKLPMHAPKCRVQDASVADLVRRLFLFL